MSFSKYSHVTWSLNKLVISSFKEGLEDEKDLKMLKGNELKKI